MKAIPLFATLWLLLSTAVQAAPAPFTVAGEGSVAPIVISPELAPEGWSFEKQQAQPPHRTTTDELYAVTAYLHEAIVRISGEAPQVVVGPERKGGIFLTTPAGLPEALKGDAAITRALAAEREDGIDAAEAFHGRSTEEGIVIVAHRLDGIAAGVVAMLESVGYEVLGMGPNWTHVPDFKGRPVTLQWEESSRPGFYNRLLAPTTGQAGGVGTLNRIDLPHEPDETVHESYRRWRVGTRQLGMSMPRIRGGHALERYHRHVVQAMHDQDKTEGLLYEKVTIGEESERPPADASNEGAFWINRGEKGKLPRCFRSDGKEWKERNLVTQGAGASLDTTSELVRSIIFNTLITRSEAAFAEAPDDPFHFQTEPEDGSPQYARIAQMVKNPQWYPEYLAAQGVKFGSYKLHGFMGVDQPTEQWDPSSPSDVIYALNNWLLREYDRYIDSLPPEQQVTATGKSKKKQVYCNLLSYNYHDVPPHFNLDQRIRIKIAGFPKNRGRGEWRQLVTSKDMAAAYRQMLPGVPSVIYEIWSQAYFHDLSAGSIKGSITAPEIAEQIRGFYDAGIRGVEAETDFNFGKYGLRYYLLTKALWNPQLTAGELDALRDRWMQRSFGPAWQEMKAYYDFMAPSSSSVNSPSRWGQAIRLIDAAAQKARAADAPEAAQRIDEVKQFWYFYYLTESGQASEKSEALRTFLWKGQTSYQTAMVMVAKRFFNNRYRVVELVGEDLLSQPAHYTAEETQAWWNEVLAFWPEEKVELFAHATLANGRKGSEVDLHDLVRIPQFTQAEEAENVIIYNFLPGPLLNRQEPRFDTHASRDGEEIGFKLLWPAQPPNRRPNSATTIAYGISRWDAGAKEWQQEVDITQSAIDSRTEIGPDGAKWFIAEGRYVAPRAGTYRIELGSAAVATHLTLPDYDLATGKSKGTAGQTYDQPLGISSGSPRRWYFYIPKGTRHLHLETATRGEMTVELRKGLPGGEWAEGRRIRLRDWGVKRLEIREGEDGSVAIIEARSAPYLYTVPMLFAKSPAALLIPRAIAEADGLLHP